ncbi:MAG: septum formation protein Maf [Bacilli bacterium]|nr:septum formation protein Maf [Bacilli bacterium]
MKIILASNSPRRQEIIKEANINYEIIPSKVDEIFNHNISIEEAVMDLAHQKAKDVSDKLTYEALVIGADTIVVINNEVLGKPKDYNDAKRMLNLLQNDVHQVLTGVSLIKGNKTLNFYEKTEVYFKPMTDADIERYIEEENVYDKAGSYAIQGEAMKYIDHIEGDYYNVIGLPINRLLEEMKKI